MPGAGLQLASTLARGGARVAVVAERLLAEREQTIEDLRHRLDSEAEERRRLTARLTDQREPAGAAASVARRFWQRLFRPQ